MHDNFHTSRESNDALVESKSAELHDAVQRSKSQQDNAENVDAEHDDASQENEQAAAIQAADDGPKDDKRAEELGLSGRINVSTKTILRPSTETSPLTSALDELGFTPVNRRFFQTKELVKGIAVPTFHPDGTSGPHRVIQRNKPHGDARWNNEPALERPQLFNSQYVRSLQRRGEEGPVIPHPVRITNSELDCMVLHQINMPAVAMFGNTNVEDVVVELMALGVQELHIIFSNDAVGRTNTVKLALAGRARGIKVFVRSFIDKPRGYSICDEWLAQKFEPRKLYQRLEALPIADVDTFKEWTNDPEAGLSPGESKTVSYSFTTAEQLQKEPPLNFLVEQVIPVGSVVMLSARHGSGKSALALDLGLCVSTGNDWHGLKVTQGGVLYIFAEGGGGAAKRIQAWQKFYGVEHLPDFHVYRKAMALHESDVQQELLASLKAMGTKFRLIVVDTLVICSAGLDENSARDMGRFIEALRTISRATGATCLIIHHDNKAGAYRGSTALAAGAD